MVTRARKIYFTLLAVLWLATGCSFDSGRVQLLNWNWFGTPDKVTVQRGDTLYSISKRYNVPLRDLIEISADQIDFELLEILENQEPFGQKNPKPSFLLRNISVKVDRLIGRDAQHLKLILQEGSNALEAIFFNYDLRVKQGDRVDILFTVSRNDYRGLVTPQLLIKQIIRKY